MMVYTASPFVGPEIGPLIGGVRGAWVCANCETYADLVSRGHSSLLRVVRGDGECSLERRQSTVYRTTASCECGCDRY